MPFEKGKSGNPKGRPQGKTYSFKLREQISNYCEDNIEYFLNEIKSMKTGHAKSQAFLTLLNFAIPKLTESNSVLDIENLTESELNEIFKKHFNEQR